MARGRFPTPAASPPGEKTARGASLPQFALWLLAEGPAFFVLTYTVQVEPPLGKEPSDATWKSFLRSFKLASWPKANEKTGPSEQNFPPEIWEKPRNLEQGEELPREIKEHIQQHLKKRQEVAPVPPEGVNLA